MKRLIRHLTLSTILGALALLGTGTASAEHERTLSQRGYRELRRLAHELDEVAQHANGQAQSQAWFFSRRDRQFRRSIASFSQRASEFHQRMDNYWTQPWEVNDELQSLAQEASNVQERARRSRYLGRHTLEDWNQAVSLLDQMIALYQSDLAAYRGGYGRRRQSGTAYVYVPTVYYYDAPTVHFVASYTHWPASRVEFYFSRGWSCNDLLIGFEFSRRAHVPWLTVVNHYEHYTSVYRETHRVTEVQHTRTFEERQYVWSQVADRVPVPADASDLRALAREPSQYREVEQNIVSRAVAQEYSVAPAQAERLVERGYDTGEIVRAYQATPNDRDERAVETVLKRNHQEWEALETKVEKGQTAGLQEAVADNVAADWTPKQEERVARRTADLAAPDPVATKAADSALEAAVAEAAQAAEPSRDSAAQPEAAAETPKGRSRAAQKEAPAEEQAPSQAEEAPSAEEAKPSKRGRAAKDTPPDEPVAPNEPSAKQPDSPAEPDSSAQQKESDEDSAKKEDPDSKAEEQEESPPPPKSKGRGKPPSVERENNEVGA